MLLVSLFILLVVFLTLLLPMYINFFKDLGQEIPMFMHVIQNIKDMPSKNEVYLMLYILFFTFFTAALVLGILKIKKKLGAPFIAANQLKLIVLMLNCGFSFKQSVEQIRYSSHNNAFKQLLLSGDIAIFFQETLPLSMYQLERIRFALNSGTLLNTLSELHIELEDAANARIVGLLTLAQPLMIFILGSMVFAFVYFTFIPILDSIAVL